MLLVCNPSTPIVWVNEFAVPVHDLFGIIVWRPPTWDCSCILFFPILLVLIKLKLLNFSSFILELFCPDWVGELVLVVESRFSVDMTRTRRLLATTTPCACSINLRQQKRKETEVDTHTTWLRSYLEYLWLNGGSSLLAWLSGGSFVHLLSDDF